MRSLADALLGAGAGLYLCALQRMLVSLFWPLAGGGLFVLSLHGAAAGAAAVFLLRGDGRRTPSGRDWPGWINLSWGMAALVVLFTLSGGISGGGPGMTLRPEELSFPRALLLSAPSFLAAVGLFAGSREGLFHGRVSPFLLSFGAAVAASAALSSLHPRTLAISGILLGTLPSVFPGGQRFLRFRVAALFFMAVAVLLAVPGITPLRYQSRTGSAAEEDGGVWRERTVAWGREGRLETSSRAEGWGVLSVSGGLREITYGALGRKDLAVPLDPGEDGTLDVLFVGFPTGPLLGELIGLSSDIEIVEADPAILREILRHKPELEEAAKITLEKGDVRRFLAGSERKYDLIVLGGSPTRAAHLASALAFTEDYLTTVETFTTFISHLSPRGLLFGERPGTGRIVSTLREAAQGGEVPFADKVVVLGQKGRLVAQCYFRPSGFDRGDLRQVNRHAGEKGGEIFYSPETRRKWNLYYNLVRGETPHGYYFTSPQDLSPARDERPFFDHLERLMISPAGRPLPEELGHQPETWKLQFIPPSDGFYWKVVAAGLFIFPLTVLLPAVLFAHRTGCGRHALPYPWFFLLLGTALAAALRSLLAYGRWLDFAGGAAAWIPGLFIISVGAGWLKKAPRDLAWKRAGLPLALLLALFGLGGYSLSAPAGGSGAGGLLIPAALSIAMGVLAGRFLGSHLESAGAVLPGTTPWHGSVLLLGTVTGWALANLTAVIFGFPLIWLLGAASLTAAAWWGRRL